jgi:hypothetical protein
MNIGELMAQLSAEQETTGGYLIPEYVCRPSPGLRAGCWRAVARLFWWIRWYGTYYRCIQRGTHLVRHPIWAAVDGMT